MPWVCRVFPRRNWYAALLMTALATMAHGQEALPPATQTTAGDDITAAIAGLGADDYQAREQASKTLWTAGKRAEAALSKAQASDDPETAMRAKRLLRNIQIGIAPDSPPDVRSLVEEYAGADEQRKREIINQLQHGKTAAVAMRLLESDENKQFRQQMLPGLAANNELIGMLLEEKDPSVEQLLELSLAQPLINLGNMAGMGMETRAAKYAAYEFLNGQADAKIAALEKRSGAKAVANDPLLLAYLYRAKGEAAAARRWAGKYPPGTMLQMAILTGDWAQAAAIADQDGLAAAAGSAAGDAPGAAAAYRHLAQYSAQRTPENAARLEALVGRICRLADDPQNPGLDRSGETARTLMLLGNTDRAIELLKSHGQLDVLFEVLVAQDRIKEALAILEQPLPPVGAGATPASREDMIWHLHLAGARVCLRLGDAARADGQIQELRRRIDGATDDVAAVPLRRELIAMEQECSAQAPDIGIKARDDALAGLAKLEANDNSYQNIKTLLSPLFPQRSTELGPWWIYFRCKFPKDDGAAILGRLADLLAGKMAQADVEAAIGELGDLGNTSWTATSRSRVTAAANTISYMDSGLDPEALGKLLGAGMANLDPGTTLRIAARAAAAGKREIAKAWCNLGLEAKPRDAVFMWRSGWAMAQAGPKEAGTERMARASRLPLSDNSDRLKLADNMRLCGQHAEADKQLELIVNLGTLDRSYYDAMCALGERLAEVVGESGIGKSGVGKSAGGQAMRAADMWEAGLLPFFSAGATMADNASYVTIPARIHGIRAIDLLESGDSAGAMKEIAAALAGEKGHVETMGALVLRLEAAGQKAQAAELYARQRAHCQEMCRDWPKAGYLHDKLARLCCACRRETETAMEHAQQAVALEPRTASFWDTLAQVYFRQAKVELAIASAKKALRLQPDSESFQRHLEEFQTAAHP